MRCSRHPPSGCHADPNHFSPASARGHSGESMQLSTEQSSNSGSLAMYLSEINQYALLSVDEEQALARRFIKGDLAAGHRLVTSNLRFVVKVAYEYRSYGIKMSDLIQEGNIGLMKAVQKFDPDKGIRLISYAVFCLKKKTTSALRRHPCGCPHMLLSHLVAAFSVVGRLVRAVLL